MPCKNFKKLENFKLVQWWSRSEEVRQRCFLLHLWTIWKDPSHYPQRPGYEKRSFPTTNAEPVLLVNAILCTHGNISCSLFKSISYEKKCFHLPNPSETCPIITTCHFISVGRSSSIAVQWDSTASNGNESKFGCIWIGLGQMASCFSPGVKKVGVADIFPGKTLWFCEHSPFSHPIQQQHCPGGDCCFPHLVSSKWVIPANQGSWMNGIASQPSESTLAIWQCLQEQMKSRERLFELKTCFSVP